MPKRQEEGILSDQIRAAICSAGYWCHNNEVGFDHTKKIKYGLGVGSADLIAIVRGRFCALEVKTDLGRVSTWQKLWLAAVRKQGAFGAVVRSPAEALDALRRCLEGLHE